MNSRFSGFLVSSPTAAGGSGGALPATTTPCRLPQHTSNTSWSQRGCCAKGNARPDNTQPGSALRGSIPVMGHGVAGGENLSSWNSLGLAHLVRVISVWKSPFKTTKQLLAEEEEYFSHLNPGITMNTLCCPPFTQGLGIHSCRMRLLGHRRALH